MGFIGTWRKACAGLTSKVFLGREHFNPKTLQWTFRDGSGAVPEEMRQDMYDACDIKNGIEFNGASVLETLFAWKDRLMANAGLTGAARHERE